MSDRVVVMFSGKVAQAGVPRDIYERPVSRAVAEFVGRVNLLPATVLETSKDTCRVQTFLGQVVVQQAPSAAVGQAVDVALRPESISLLAATDSVGVAKVTSASYGGGLIDYRVEVAPGWDWCQDISQPAARRCCLASASEAIRICARCSCMARGQ